MPPGFYNPYDQQVYDAGFKFIPQSKFLINPFKIPTKDSTTPPNTGGITTLPRDRGGGTYTGGISDLTGDFFKTISDRQNRLTELNRPLAEAQFPSFKGARTSDLDGDPYGLPEMKGFSANEMYNRAAAAKAAGQDTMPSFAGITNVDEAMKYADDRIQDHRMRYATGQLGPSFIPAEKPTLNRRIQDAFYSLPFLSKPQSADQIIAEGYTGQSNMPGIMSMAFGMLDKYGELPRGDQAFIARNMGYTGPTVFGENASNLGKDPFGLNVRSGFGNYAERVGKEYASLGDSLSGRLSDKYGVEFDEETGMFVGSNAAKANQMTKMMRAKYNFYKQQTAQRDADRKAAEEAEKAAAAAAEAERQRVAQVQGRLDSGTYVDRDDSGLSASDRAVGGGAKGRAANIDDDRSTGTSQGYTQHYMDGGIVDMLEIYD